MTAARRFSISLDCLLFVAACLLQAKLFTGVPRHEWIGVAFVAALLVHLTLHWPWLVSRARRWLSGEATVRTRVNYILNLALLVDMIVSIVSGLMLSDTVLRRGLTLTSGRMLEYLRWHRIHELSSHLILVTLGLHLAINWSLVASFLRRRRRASAAPRRAAPAVGPAAMLVRSASVFAAVALLGGSVYLAGTRLPFTKGERAEAAVVAEMVRRGPEGERGPRRNGRPGRRPSGIPPLIATVVVSGLMVVGGRKILRLRLD